MVRSVNSQIPKPETGSGFENLIADLVDARYNSDAHRNARSGQADDGVDVYVNEGGEWIGVQCKNTKTLSGKQIQKEIFKAKAFSPALSHYIIATTAPLDRETQQQIREQSEDNVEFSVDLWTWDDISRYLNNNPEVLKSHYGSIIPESNSFDSLEQAGLLELSHEYFENRSTRKPADCWRTGFSLAEAKAGYPFDRGGTSSNSFSHELVERLSEDGDIALIGHPGSGKSTICRMTACHWQEKENHRVFYRPGDTSTPLTISNQLVDELSKRSTNDLVVVEDALRDSSDGLFELVQRMKSDDNVRFLLDSRYQDWQESKDQPIRAGQAQATTYDVDQISVPPISENDVDRAITHYSRLTGQEVQATTEFIYRMIDDSEMGGDGLLLAHLVDLYSGTSSHTRAEQADKDILYHSAVDFLDRLDTKGKVVTDTAILISVLSAAGIGVCPEIVHGLITEDYSHNEIASSLDELSGDLIYGASGEHYQTRHEIWCSKFLQVFLESQSREIAIERFESAINAIFSILDDSSIRSSICDWIRRDPFPEDIDSSYYSDFFVTRIFSIGLRNPKLATLFSTSEYSKINLSDTVSKPTEIHTRIWRGVMRFERSGIEQGESDLELARREFRNILKISQTDETIPDSAALNMKSLALTNLAAVNFDEGDYETSKEYLMEARKISERLQDKEGLSYIHSWVGNIEIKQGNNKQAEESYREAIRYDRELYNHASWAANLSNIAEVKSSSGQYDAARRLTDTALQFFKEVNDKQGQAICYSRLANIDRMEGKMESALSYLRHSLRLKSDTGSELQLASTMLGFARMVTGPFSHDTPIPVEEALEFAQKARKIFERAGNNHGATVAKGTIGSINLRLGNTEKGIRLQEEVIEVYKELGDQSNLAAAYNDLVQGYLLQDRLFDVVEVSEKAIELNRELGEQEQLVISLFTRGQAFYKLNLESLAVQDMAESAAVSSEINAYPLFVEAIDYLRDIHPNGKIRYGLSLKAYSVAKNRDDTTAAEYFKWKSEMELFLNYPDLYYLVHGDESDALGI